MNFTLQRSGADTEGGPDPKGNILVPPLNLLENRYLKLSVWFGT